MSTIACPNVVYIAVIYIYTKYNESDNNYDIDTTAESSMERP